jgi:importin subunit alpha-6/7
MYSFLPSDARIQQRNLTFFSALDSVDNKHDFAIELRKKSRQKFFNSKRALPQSLSTPEASSEVTFEASLILQESNQYATVSKLLLLAIAHQTNPKNVAYCFSLCNRYLLTAAAQKMVIESEYLWFVFECLRSGDEGVLQQTTFMMANLATADQLSCMKLHEHSVLNHLLYLCSHYTGEIQKNCLWCIANLCIDSLDTVEYLISCSFHKYVIESLSSNPQADSKFYEILSYLCKTIQDPNEFTQVFSICLRVFQAEHNEPYVLASTLWVLFKSLRTNENIQHMLNLFPSMLQLVIKFAGEKEYEVGLPSVKILGLVAGGMTIHTQQLIDAGGLDVLQVAIKNSNANIRKEAYFALSNVAAGVAGQLQAMFKQKDLIIDTLFGALDQNDEVRNEAWHMLYYISVFRNKDFLRKLADFGVVVTAAQVLSIEDDNDTLQYVLMFCEHLLLAGDCEGMNTMTEKFEESGCFAEIAQMREHQSNKISQIAERILEASYRCY